MQEAFIRYQRARADGTAVESPKAWLSAVVTRLAIDHLRSARVRRETYVGEWLPEPLVTDEGAGDPAASHRTGRVAVDVVPPPARAADPGRAGGLPPPRCLRLRLRGGQPDRPADPGDVPTARGPCSALHRREPAAVRRVGGEARRARRVGSSPRPAGATSTGSSSFSAEDVVVHGDGGGKVPQWSAPIVGADKVARLFALMGRQMQAIGRVVRGTPGQRPAGRRLPGPARGRVLGDVGRGRRRAYRDRSARS